MKCRRNLFTVYRVVEGKRIIFKCDSNFSFELDDVGVLIWRYLDGSRDNVMIAELIAQNFNCSKEEVLEDVNKFVSSLESHNLVDNLQIQR